MKSRPRKTTQMTIRSNQPKQLNLTGEATTTKTYKYATEVAPPEGLEPSTHELTARCSTELSYGGSVNHHFDDAIVRICGAI